VRVHPDSAVSAFLSGGEVLLAIDGLPITRPRDVERAIANRKGTNLALTLVQDGQVLSLEVPPFKHTHQGVVNALLFGGAILHDPHPQVGLLHGIDPGGVYVAWYWYGTPAAKSELRASQLIRSVNERPVADLAAFIEAIRELDDGEAIRLETESLNATKGLVTLETDLIYWPTATIGLKAGKWNWSLLDASEHPAP
jgi:S1-C subfamily serine protease